MSPKSIYYSMGSIGDGIFVMGGFSNAAGITDRVRYWKVH